MPFGMWATAAAAAGTIRQLGGIAQQANGYQQGLQNAQFNQLMDNAAVFAGGVFVMGGGGSGGSGTITTAGSNGGIGGVRWADVHWVELDGAVLPASMYQYQGPGSDVYVRAEKLLLSLLTPAQQDTYRRAQYFSVRGGKSGETYTIMHAISMNVRRAGKFYRREMRFCAMPMGWHSLPIPDIMLAQKLALENDEETFLARANVM